MSRVDSGSQTWAAVKEWVENQIKQDRERLESPACDEIETAGLRASIAKMKQLMTLADAPRHPKPLRSEY